MVLQSAHVEKMYKNLQPSKKGAFINVQPVDKESIPLKDTTRKRVSALNQMYFNSGRNSFLFFVDCSFVKRIL